MPRATVKSRASGPQVPAKPYDRCSPIKKGSGNIRAPRKGTNIDDADAIRELIASPDFKDLDPSIVLQLVNLPFLGELPTDVPTQTKTYEYPDLRLLKDTDELNIDSANRTCDLNQAASKAMKIVYLIEHSINDDDLRTRIIPSAISDPSHREQVGDRLKAQQSEIQRQKWLYFSKGVFATRKAYTTKYFDLATAAQRRQIFDTIWEQGPYTIARLMLGQCASVIDLENIFFYHDKQEVVRKGWRHAFRAIFSTACELVCLHCPQGEASASAKQLWYKDWAMITSDAGFRKNFSGWDLPKLPVPFEGQIYSRRKHHAATSKLSEAFAARPDLE